MAGKSDPTQVDPTAVGLFVLIAVVVLVAVLWLFTASGFFLHGGSPPIPTTSSTATPTTVSNG